MADVVVNMAFFGIIGALNYGGKQPWAKWTIAKYKQRIHRGFDKEKVGSNPTVR